jgi:hypothetical protein
VSLTRPLALKEDRLRIMHMGCESSGLLLWVGARSGVGRKPYLHSIQNCLLLLSGIMNDIGKLLRGSYTEAPFRQQYRHDYYQCLRWKPEDRDPWKLMGGSTGADEGMFSEAEAIQRFHTVLIVSSKCQIANSFHSTAVRYRYVWARRSAGWFQWFRGSVVPSARQAYIL